MTAEIIKLPYSVIRAAHSQKPRRSKNGTPEERAAKAAAAKQSTAIVIDLDAPVAPPAPHAVPTGDPAFALIAKKRAADTAHNKAIEAQDAAETCHGASSHAATAASDQCDAAGSLVNKIELGPGDHATDNVGWRRRCAPACQRDRRCRRGVAAH